MDLRGSKDKEIIRVFEYINFYYRRKLLGWISHHATDFTTYSLSDYTLGVCGYPINLGTRCSGRVEYPSGRVLVVLRNNRVPEMIGYLSRLSGYS